MRLTVHMQCIFIVPSVSYIFGYYIQIGNTSNHCIVGRDVNNFISYCK